MKNWVGRRLRSPRNWIALAVLLAALPQAFAWHHLREGRSALADDRTEAARRHLEQCRRIWPWENRVEVRLLASRLARRDGDPGSAMDELHEAGRIAGEVTAEMSFEWALIQASDGNVSEVAEFLQQKANADPSLQRAVWEAIAEGYLAVYRGNDAYAIAREWTDRYPDSLRAMELRGRAAIQGRGRGLQLGTDDLREVLRRDPTRTQVRVIFAVTLLDLGLFDEAIPECERLVRDQPDQPDHRVRLARCLKMTNRAGEAMILLEEVLQTNPDHGLALRTRGQFALADFQPAEAITWLSKAAEALPNDYQTQYLHHQALLQAGRREEADGQLKRAETVRRQTMQLADLRKRRLAERPLDPALYAEMGSLLLKTGNAGQGVRWLEEALSLDPAFQPAHAALADYFEKTGKIEQATFHRHLATSGR